LTASVGVVVITLNAKRTVESCLRSLRAQTIPSTLVVVDYFSTDGTLDIARRVADMVLVGPPGLTTPPPFFSAQRNFGAAHLDTDILAFIDADMVLEATVLAEAVAAVNGGCGGVVMPERTIGEGFWTSVRAFERTFYLHTNVESARVFSRSIFDRVGGFDVALTANEDIDLHLRVAAISAIGRTQAFINHDEGFTRFLGLVRKKAAYASGMEAFVAKYRGAAVSYTLDRPYVRRPWLLMYPHPWRGACLLALKGGEALAVLLKVLQHRHRRTLLKRGARYR
jgi:glycosyltransferase involved in cell wall biosynthesis